MNEYQWVSLISLGAVLIFLLSGWRSHNVGWRKGFYMAGAWAGIFAIVILFVSLVTGG